MSAPEPRIVLGADESGGVVSIAEQVVPAGWPGQPLHRHPFDEAVYVAEGALVAEVGERLVRADAGGLVFVPAGVDHAMANPADEDARYAIVRADGSEEPFAEAGDEGAVLGERRELGDAEPVEEVPGGVRVLVRGADGEDRVALMDNTVPGGTGGPPLHHHDFDEAFYLLDGRLTFQLGDGLIERGPGEVAFAPRGAHHTFANPNDAPARMLLVCTPAGFERYFQQMAARNAGVEPPPEALEPWPEVTVVGPQIGKAG